jgi:glycosyltransferase involved in cell wall biosynthesis
MKIGIDARPLQESLAGVGRYVASLCTELDAVLPEAEFILYGQRALKFQLPSARWSVRLEPSSFFSRRSGVSWLKTRAGMLARQDELDIFWGCAFFLPWGMDSRVRRVITVHDVVSIVESDTMTWTHRLAHRLFFKADVRSADAVVVNSNGTAERLLRFTGRVAAAVITPGISEIFRRATDDEVAACKARFAISGKYLLGVGTLEPRKNLPLLIDAFKNLKRQGALPAHKLVLAGAKGWKHDEISRALAADTSEIIALGYVKDEDLVRLYSGADVFVFPSRYEGFGMPVLEARACGTPVVATDISEIREAGGDDAIYVHPTQSDLCKGILRGIQLRSTTSRSVTTPSEISHSWKEGARLLANLFRSLSAQPVARGDLAG